MKINANLGISCTNLFSPGQDWNLQGIMNRSSL